MAIRRLLRLVRVQRPNVFVLCAVMVGVEALIVLVGLGQAGRPLLGGDGSEYNQYALNLLRHGVFSNAISAPFYPGVTRTPGYPAFLALLHLIDMHSLLLVRITQFALLAVIAWLIYGIASELAGVRVARISAVLCATYLPFLWLATYHLTEVVASALGTLLIFLLVRARTRPASAWLWVAVGLCIAAGAYVRPEYVGLGILIVLGILLAGSGGAWLSPGCSLRRSFSRRSLWRSLHG